MIRLLAIEWEKLRHYRAFWVIVSLYLLVFLTFLVGLPKVMAYIASQANDFFPLKVFSAVAFSFPDVWQNIAYAAGMRGFIKIFLAMLIIILVSNEFAYLTVRTKVMNGISRSQFVAGKLILVFLISILSTLMLFLAGIYLGLSYSLTFSFGLFFSRIFFLAAYFLELFTYLTFALLIGTLIRKTGFAIITLLLYIIVEPALQYYLPSSLEKFLPLNAMNNVVWSVNTTMMTYRTPDFDIPLQQHIQLADAGVCLLYAAIFSALVWLYMKKKDL
jgi:ABC-2 type transport system permease protein